MSLILKGDLDWIAIKALEKDRARRYDGPAALADDVQRYLDNEAIEAHPSSLRYRIQRVYRKYRIGFVATGVCVGMLIVGTIGTSLLWLRAASAEQFARSAAVAERAARSIAEGERNRATEAEHRTAAEKIRVAQSLARQLVSVGVQKTTESDYQGALPWLVSASNHSPDHAEVAIAVATAQSYRCGGVFVHDSRVNAAEWHSTEEMVATAGQDGFVRLWDAESGRLVSEWVHDDVVFLIAFNGDSSQLLTVSRSPQLKKFGRTERPFLKLDQIIRSPMPLSPMMAKC